MAWAGPRPLAEHLGDWVEIRPPRTVETDVEEGPPKIRRNPGAGADIIRFSQMLTGPETVSMDTYYESTLSFGTVSITDTNPRTLLSFTFRLRRPTYQIISGNHFRATMELVVLP